MKYIRLFVALIVWILIAGAVIPVSGLEIAGSQTVANNNPAKVSPVPRPFAVLDGTLYRNKPNLALYGINKANILYVSRFWPHWPAGSENSRLPDEHVVRALAREAKSSGDLAIVDIEHWKLNGDAAAVNRSIANYLQVIRWIQSEEPSLKVGYFGILPVADYARSRSGNSSRAFQQWQRENNRLAPIAQAVDIVFPSIYTYYPDQQRWQEFAIENIKEARRYNKPVYVFLWPQYSEQNHRLAGRFIGPDYWRKQLNTARNYADGVVIWGGWGDNGPADWDENAPWWKTTKEFMKQLEAAQTKP